MLHRIMPLLLLALLCRTSAAVEIMFIELYDRQGQLVQLEPGGRFYHVAVRYKDRWLHAHFHQGVALVDDLSQYGHRFFTVVRPDLPEPSDEFVAAWLGKPFDFTFRWDNPFATYCARIVADALKIAPRPMLFASPYWRQAAHRPVQEMGLSPDDLFQALWRDEFDRSCEKELVLQ